MNPAADYRKRAWECVELALAARPGDRRILLEIAETWLKLADSVAEFGCEAAFDTVPNAPSTDEVH